MDAKPTSKRVKKSLDKTKNLVDFVIRACSLRGWEAAQVLRADYCYSQVLIVILYHEWEPELAGIDRQ